MSGASKEEDDATDNRRPTGYDPKGLLFDITERSEQPNMQRGERQDYHKHPR